MLKDEQLCYIEHVLEAENEKNNLFCELLNEKNQIQEDETFEYNYDFRLDKREFQENAVNIMIRNSKKEKLFMFSLFLIPQELYHIILVWKKENKRLKKISIDKYDDYLGENILLLGYARFSNEELNTKRIGSQFRCVEIYINLIKKIRKKFHCAIYVEPEGIVELTQNGQSTNFVEIDKIPEEVLGMVGSGGKVTRKLAISLGLDKIEGYYNYYTFGPAFLGIYEFST